MYDPAVIKLYEAHCRAAGQRRSTIRLRLSWLGRVDNLIGLATATHAELLLFLAREDWSPETRKSARSALRSFYRWATEEGFLDRDPTTRLPTVRVPAGVPRPAPSAVLRRALASATDRDKIIIGLAAFAGLRRTEIAELPWTAVAWPLLHVTGKGGRSRTVPMLPALAELLSDARARRERGQVGTGWRYAVDPASPFVLPSHAAPHLSPYTVGVILSAHLGDGWTGHTLRHRFATKAYEVDRDLLTVQQLLGHSKPETTARYTAVPAGAAARAVAGVAA